MPAKLPAPGDERIRHEAVADDEQTGAVPERAARLVEDRRGQSDGPRTAGVVDPDLGPAQAVGIGRDEWPMIDQRAAGLGQGEQRSRLSTAGPADPGANATRVLDREEMRLDQAPAPC